MKSLTINGSQRESVGKSATKALRNAGKVPCVVYGGDEPVHFSADVTEFNHLIYTPDVHTVALSLGNGTTIDAVLQDIQFHPVTDEILHIDFYRLFEGKPISMNVPVRITGNSRGVKNGGVLRVITRQLRVKALPKNLPDFIEVDITQMRIGDVRMLSDIETTDFEFLHPDNTTICQVRTSRTAIADEEDEDEEGEEGAEAAAEGGEAPAEGATEEAAQE